MTIGAKELKKKYIEFFKKQKHSEIPSASLIPENDPTVLFTTAGMHPLVPFLLGQSHPKGKRIVDVQKCIRTTDIDSVGDDFHLTFFEMLGNWSLGDYFKKEAITWSFEFLTKELKIPIEKIAVTCFAGDANASQDLEAAKIWKSLGIPDERIFFLPKTDNWWGPAGETGPCGPDTEMFYFVGTSQEQKKDPGPGTKGTKYVEIWNDVFMQYNKTKQGKFELLKQQNVDTGMGVERTTAVLQGKKSVYELEEFQRIILKIREFSKIAKPSTKQIISERIITDHIRASTFILGDDKKLIPSNVERGYVLRRILRRAIRHGMELGIKENFCSEIAKIIVEIYKPEYPELDRNKRFIFDELDKEEIRFKETLTKGIHEFERIIKQKISQKQGPQIISGNEAFLLFQSYGFPLEMTKELAAEKGFTVNTDEYEKDFEKHQELSRTATIGKFASGLADTSEMSTKYHTATHLLHKALQVVLGPEAKQRGSNITPERMRFDFSWQAKMTSEQIKKAEDLVNEKIKQGLTVKKEEMSLEQAKKQGAMHLFGEKYPDKVSVYTIYDPKTKKEFSKEICTGPHVKNTSELGHFKIQKEESSSAGVRRIKAVLE